MPPHRSGVQKSVLATPLAVRFRDSIDVNRVAPCRFLRPGRDWRCFNIDVRNASAGLHPHSDHVHRKLTDAFDAGFEAVALHDGADAGRRA